MIIKHIASRLNRYGETEHSFQVGEETKTYCIPMGARQSVEGLLRMLEREHNGPRFEIINLESREDCRLAVEQVRKERGL